MTPLSSSLDMARQANATQSQNDMQQKLVSLRSSNLSPEAKEKKLREACAGFESIFIQKMWKEMRKTVHQTSFMHGKEEQFWQDMYDQELAKKMTSAGGIGLSNMMYEQLSSHLASASRATANSLGVERHFVPSAAPLIDQPKETPKNTVDVPMQQASFYEEAAKDGQLSSENKNGAPSQLYLPPKPAQQHPVYSAHPVQQPSYPIDDALNVMRSNVATKAQISDHLATVNYEEQQNRQQPLGNGLSNVNAVKRQAHDQLGSRGVREPLLPQTAKARNATLRGYEQRANKVNGERTQNQQNLAEPKTNQMQAQAPVNQVQAQSPANQELIDAVTAANQPKELNLEIGQVPSDEQMPEVATSSSLVVERTLPGKNVTFVPRNKQVVAPTGQNQEEQPNYRKITFTTNKPPRQQRQRKMGQNLIQTLNLDAAKQKFANQPTMLPNHTQPNVQQPLAAPSYIQPKDQAVASAQLPSAQVESQNRDKESNYNIPPLSVSDLKS